MSFPSRFINRKRRKKKRQRAFRLPSSEREWGSRHPRREHAGSPLSNRQPFPHWPRDPQTRQKSRTQPNNPRIIKVQMAWVYEITLAYRRGGSRLIRLLPRLRGDWITIQAPWKGCRATRRPPSQMANDLGIISKGIGQALLLKLHKF